MAITNFVEAIQNRVKKTIQQVITDALVEQGIEQAVAAHLEFQDGRERQVISDADPILDEEVLEGEEPRVVFSQSAKAGMM